jgi:hypothetical protein
MVIDQTKPSAFLRANWLPATDPDATSTTTLTTGVLHRDIIFHPRVVIVTTRDECP